MSDILNSERNPMRTVLSLAVPSIFEQLLMCLASLIDTAMVGALGAVATASIGINDASIWFIQGFIMAVSTGFMYIIARRIGEGNMDKARKAAREAITFSFIFGGIIAVFVFFAAGFVPVWLGAEPEVAPHAINYLRIVGISFLFMTITSVLSSSIRSAGNAKVPLVINTAANLLNIVGNLFLINSQINLSKIGINIVLPGAGLGVEGAALSTMLSRVFSAIAFLICMYVVDTPIKIKPAGDYGLTSEDMRIMVKIGVPTAMERCSLSVGAIIVTAVISTIGTNAIAAHHLTDQIEGILYLPAYGIAYTATTLIGQTVGAGRYDMAKKYAWLCVKLNTAVILLVCIPIFIMAEPIVGIFTPDEAVISLGTITLRLAAGFELLFSSSIVGNGICRGSGDVKLPLFVSLIGVWAIRLELVYLFGIVFKWGLVGVWIAISADVSWRGIMLLLRLKSNKWLPEKSSETTEKPGTI